MASTDLFHLDAHVEGICEHADELAEVHTPVSDVVEDRLVAIALIFDVPDLHVEAQRRGDLSSLDHRRLFTALGFLPALEVTRAGDAVDVEELPLVGAVAMVLHRQLSELTSEGHLADVVTRRRFDGDDIAFIEVDPLGIEIVALAGILELHFDQVGALQ